jgi:hypothetical protein
LVYETRLANLQITTNYNGIFVGGWLVCYLNLVNVVSFLNSFFGVPYLATFIFVIFTFAYIIASIAYIHPVYGTGA